MEKPSNYCAVRAHHCEADETFIGGKARNMQVAQRQRRNYPARCQSDDTVNGGDAVPCKATSNSLRNLCVSEK